MQVSLLQGTKGHDSDGDADGEKDTVGDNVGDADGEKVGDNVGLLLGRTIGRLVGFMVGFLFGFLVRFLVGFPFIDLCRRFESPRRSSSPSLLSSGVSAGTEAGHAAITASAKRIFPFIAFIVSDPKVLPVGFVTMRSNCNCSLRRVAIVV
jgi:hypothetical protein